MRSEELVEISLKALEKGRVVCIPGVKRWFLVKFASVLPRRVYYKVMQVLGEKIKKRWDEVGKIQKVR